MGALPEAKASYRRLLTEHEGRHIDSLDVSMTGFKAHHNLTLVYLNLQRLKEAEVRFLCALHDNEGFTPSGQGLLDRICWSCIRGRTDNRKRPTATKRYLRKEVFLHDKKTKVRLRQLKVKQRHKWHVPKL